MAKFKLGDKVVYKSPSTGFIIWGTLEKAYYGLRPGMMSPGFCIQDRMHRVDFPGEHFEYLTHIEDLTEIERLIWGVE